MNISTINNELRSFRAEIKQREENTQKLIQLLTEEVVALRNEVRQLKSVAFYDGDLNLLPQLPFHSIDLLREFDKKVLDDDNIKNQFVSL